MKCLLIFVFFIFSSLYANINLESFQTYVDSVVPGSRLGISVRSVKSGKELAQIRGAEKFTPASTLKTLTTATAIHFLPLDYEPETFITLLGSVQKKEFIGKIQIRGEGDPNFSGRYYGDPFYMINVMVDSIKALGIDSIKGQIELDTAFYSGPYRAEHWRRNFYDAWYGAEIAPLDFNDNCTMIRFKPGAKEGDTAIVSILPNVGYVTIKNELITTSGKKRKWIWSLDSAKSFIHLRGTIGINVDSANLVLPIRNPVEYFKSAFLYALKEKGIVFYSDSLIPTGIEIKKFRFSAAPFLSLLDEINQRSQNYHAETLFRNMGGKILGKGNVENGKILEEKFLSEIGLDFNDFEVWDGSGLSPKNKIKPSIETQMLAKMARHPRREFYINSFAGPKIGTGSKRMTDLKYPWLTRFKTGFIGEAHGLVGYIFPMDGDTLTVAMYLNETGKNKDATLKDVLDTLWMRLIYLTNNDYSSLLKMKSLWIQGQNIKGLNNRLEYFSRQLLGTPYLLGPMGESYLDSIENKPIVYIDSLDCVTFLEHTLALSISKDENAIFKNLQKIRYKNGVINYTQRKHYLLADWVSQNPFTHILTTKDDTTITKKIGKNEFFYKKGLRYQENGENISDPEIEIRFIPYEKALSWAEKINDDSLKVLGVAFLTSIENLDATHTGFIILYPNQAPILRHAAYKKQVLDIPFKDYLESRKGKLPGITLFEFK